LVSIVEIERRKARGEWRDLVAGIEGGQRFGSSPMVFQRKFQQKIRLVKSSASRL
jgi:hypothetical protein